LVARGVSAPSTRGAGYLSGEAGEFSGLAMAAHDAVLERMRTNDVRRAWLRVFTANGRGRAFYEKLGWRWTGERSVSTFAPYPEHYERDL
jgi:RimJ/RimL family protein N-acetyltransferase